MVDYTFYPSCPFYVANGIVYALYDNDDKVYYIGCTLGTIENRVAGHVADAKANRSNKERNAVIQSQKFEVVARIISRHWVTGLFQSMAYRKLTHFEDKCIEDHLELGYPLCNKFRIRLDNS